MAQNPLQQYFRQPKIFISLPSKGIYNKPGTIDGDVNRLPVFGMTGMDEILLKTPDALISGESTVKVINSCCPAIVDPWDVCLLDVDLILASIRIATFGNQLNVSNVCSMCSTPNDYSLDLNRLIEHYTSCHYDNEIVVENLKITIRPLNYNQSTDFSFRNFQVQQKSRQVDALADEAAKKQAANDVISELASLRNAVFAAGIESIDTGTSVVTERAFIEEWIANVDSSVVHQIRKHIEHNQATWTPPNHDVTCEGCGHIDNVRIDLDQSNFFVNA